MALGISAAAWAAGAAVVGTAGSLYAGSQASKNAKNANQIAQDAANQQAQIAREQYDDWKTDFLPLQRDLTNMAKNAGSREELERNAELASGDVTQAFGRARGELSSRLNSYGVDPSSAKYATQFSRFGLGEAAATAGAQNKARTDTMDKAKAFKMDVYGLGKSLPATASAGLSNAASTNSMIASNQSALASRNAAGAGSLIPAIQKWWNTPSPSTGGIGNPNPPDPNNGGDYGPW